MARRHEHHVHWKHLAIYGVAAIIVLLIGIGSIWAFIDRQSLVIRPEPLPKITVVTRSADSPVAAAWVQLLTKAELQPTLVPLETFDPIEGVVVFCDVDEVPPRVAAAVDDFVKHGGAVAFVGMPPKTPIGRLHLIADRGTSDTALRFAETVSPVLARLTPGHDVQVRRTNVALLKETPRMFVDARWRDNARAAVMHLEQDGSRYVWFGFDPGTLVYDDAQVFLLLRTAFRWVAGQPVSDGAVGAPQLAKTLTPEARREARANRFAWSVDRAHRPGLLTIRMQNRGGVPLVNPTVKVWLPPRVAQVELAGDIIMNRNATLTGVPEEGACLVSLPRLTRNEDRVMKLRIVDAPPAVQNARK